MCVYIGAAKTEQERRGYHQIRESSSAGEHGSTSAQPRYGWRGARGGTRDWVAERAGTHQVLLQGGTEEGRCTLPPGGL